MILPITTYTLVHVLLSVTGIVAGLVLAGALSAGARPARWAAVFLVTTVLTNVTGFGFPFVTLMPSHIVGGLSLVILGLVAVAHHVKHFAGLWRTVYVVGVVTSTYFNVFVLVTQLFRKVPALIALAPKQSEPPFAISQILVLGLFVWLGVVAVRGYRKVLT